MSSVFGALIPPVDLVPAEELGPVHFIAIGGAGMSGIASLYAGLGVPVSGSDQADSPTLAELADQGIRTFIGHAASQLGEAETVVVSSAIRADNPELVAARERGLRIWHRSAALGALMLGRQGIAVAGTHGKTTTTAMIAHILNRCGVDPGYVVGAPMADGRSSRLGSGPFVVEADESDGSFLQYPADVAVITNIEADHLDNWETPQAYARGFADFATRAGMVVADIDDPGVQQLAPQHHEDTGRQLITYGRSEAAKTRLDDVRTVGLGVTATVAGVPLQLPVPGLHNAYNAAAAILATHCVGIDPRQACAALADYGGTHRRFQPIGEVRGIRVFDDYAHHPTELAATLTAARVGVSDTGGRLIAIFQPHLFSRTRDFATEFGQALAGADEVVLTDIYPSREDPIEGVTSDLLVEPCRAAGGSVRRCSFDQVPAVVREIAAPADVVLTLGAGDVTLLAPRIVAALSDEPGPGSR